MTAQPAPSDGPDIRVLCPDDYALIAWVGTDPEEVRVHTRVSPELAARMLRQMAADLESEDQT